MTKKGQWMQQTIRFQERTPPTYFFFIRLVGVNAELLVNDLKQFLFSNLLLKSCHNVYFCL